MDWEKPCQKLKGSVIRHNIEIAIKKLQIIYPESEFYFWGKIEGNYFIFKEILISLKFIEIVK